MNAVPHQNFIRPPLLIAAPGWLEQGGREAAPLLAREGLRVGGEDLQADVVGAGGAVLIDLPPDHILVPPGDQGVEQAIIN